MNNKDFKDMIDTRSIEELDTSIKLFSRKDGDYYNLFFTFKNSNYYDMFLLKTFLWLKEELGKDNFVSKKDVFFMLLEHVVKLPSRNNRDIDTILQELENSIDEK